MVDRDGDTYSGTVMDGAMAAREPVADELMRAAMHVGALTESLSGAGASSAVREGPGRFPSRLQCCRRECADCGSVGQTRMDALGEREYEVV